MELRYLAINLTFSYFLLNTIIQNKLRQCPLLCSEFLCVPVYGPPSEWGCGRCGRAVGDTEEGVQCDGPCRSWVHTHCGNISPSVYRGMVKDEAEGRHTMWLCPGQPV